MSLLSSLGSLQTTEGTMGLLMELWSLQMNEK